jgi:hypothetical protein
VKEKDLVYTSNTATPKNASLMAKRKPIPRLGAKARYLLRDTLKVVGDPEQGLAPSDVGFSCTKPDPISVEPHAVPTEGREHAPVAQWPYPFILTETNRRM